jgi:hypothetical protein
MLLFAIKFRQIRASAICLTPIIGPPRSFCKSYLRKSRNRATPEKPPKPDFDEQQNNTFFLPSSKGNVIFLQMSHLNSAPKLSFLVKLPDLDRVPSKCLFAKTGAIVEQGVMFWSLVLVLVDWKGFS